MFALDDDQRPKVRFSGYVLTKYKQTNNGSELWVEPEALHDFWLTIPVDSRYLQQGVSGKAPNWNPLVGRRRLEPSKRMYRCGNCCYMK